MRMAILALVLASGCGRTVSDDPCHTGDPTTCAGSDAVRVCETFAKLLDNSAYWVTRTCGRDGTCVQVADDAACVYSPPCDPKTTVPVVTAEPQLLFIDVLECTQQLGDKTYLQHRSIRKCDPKTFKPQCYDERRVAEICVPLEPKLAALAPGLHQVDKVECGPQESCNEQSVCAKRP
ncbi:MAG: hypothetical protein ABI867_30725 [Kofleriaceae bacterium]